MNAQPLKDSPTRFEPQSSESEKAVLGCILINNDSISAILEYLSSNSFYDNNAAGQRVYVTLYRSIGGGTASNVLTGSGAGRGLMEFWNPDQRIQTSIMTQYLDSPATTSPVTYTAYAIVSSGSIYLGLYNNQKFMHAMEVSG